MFSSSFIDHLPHVFFGSLGVALLVGVVRSAAPAGAGLTPGRRAARLVGVPLAYLALVVGLGHAASFAPATSAAAMAFALVSPVSRAGVARKLAARIRANEKTDRALAELVALDLAVRDCEAAQSDAYRFRARATWPRVVAACGPSERAARALFEDARFEDAAVAFESARRARPGARMEIDELTAYVLAKHTEFAAATLRAMEPHGPRPGALSCMADAIATYGGATAPPSERSRCQAMGLVFDFPSVPKPRYEARRWAPSTCAPHRKAGSDDSSQQQACGVDHPYFAPPGLILAFASDETDPPAAIARWRLHVDDAAGAFGVVDRELESYSWAAPLYARALREEHQALMRLAQRDYPELVWIRTDCHEELRVPAGHPLAERAARDRELYDPARDAADQANLEGREEALAWAYDVAVEGLDGARAKRYEARSSRGPAAAGEPATFRDRRLPLLLAFSSEAARAFFGASAALDDAALGDAPLRDEAVRDAAIAGSGTRLAERLRALDVSGAGVVDVVGLTIPEGREALASFSRHDARFACHEVGRRSGPRCSVVALLGALGARHRVARAVGDERTVRETREALDRVIALVRDPWVRSEVLGTVLGVAGLLLNPPEGDGAAPPRE